MSLKKNDKGKFRLIYIDGHDGAITVSGDDDAYLPDGHEVIDLTTEKKREDKIKELNLKENGKEIVK